MRQEKNKGRKINRGMMRKGAVGAAPPNVDYCETFLRFTRNIHVHLRAESREIKRCLTMRGKNLKGFSRCFGAMDFS